VCSWVVQGTPLVSAQVFAQVEDWWPPRFPFRSRNGPPPIAGSHHRGSHYPSFLPLWQCRKGTRGSSLDTANPRHPSSVSPSGSQLRRSAQTLASQLLSITICKRQPHTHLLSPAGPQSHCACLPIAPAALPSPPSRSHAPRLAQILDRPGGAASGELPSHTAVARAVDVSSTWAASRGVSENGAVLVRPDGHVAWRWNALGPAEGADLPRRLAAMFGRVAHMQPGAP